ncbi:hypothetical protein F2Q70_00036056 [Brassica cretica]|uniref:Transposase MuDR plant domain-containing protein n=1 Tax=Brassica cretica TaxID=69181 RepID=A0A8S9GFU1_BRACR|nr:hypothetical protein F2Q68_00031263 [Brassica cretica]KAF2587713.1 hypothetical protein F2Q70_00036056 [Brassica cretica]
MAQEDYNLDMNREVVDFTYSLPEEMMQQMAPDTLHIHVTMKDEDEDKDEVEADDMSFEGFKAPYASEGGSSNMAFSDNIYVNQSFVIREALVSELRLTAVKLKFSFKLYKVTKTLVVAKCCVAGCGWKLGAGVKHETNTFWVTKYLKTHTCSVSDRLAQRKHSTPKYVGKLFIDRVGIIDGLNPKHIQDAMKNMQRTRIRIGHGRAQVWQSNHAQAKLGRYVATEHEHG